MNLKFDGYIKEDGLYSSWRYDQWKGNDIEIDACQHTHIVAAYACYKGLNFDFKLLHKFWNPWWFPIRYPRPSDKYLMYPRDKNHPIKFFTKYSAFNSPWNMTLDNGNPAIFGRYFVKDASSVLNVKAWVKKSNYMFFNRFTTRGELKTIKGKTLDIQPNWMNTFTIGDICFPHIFLWWDLTLQAIYKLDGINYVIQYEYMKKMSLIMDAFIFHWLLSWFRPGKHAGSTAGTVLKFFMTFAIFEKKDLAYKIAWKLIRNGRYKIEEKLHEYYIDEPGKGRVHEFFDITTEMVDAIDERAKFL